MRIKLMVQRYRNSPNEGWNTPLEFSQNINMKPAEERRNASKITLLQMG